VASSGSGAAGGSVIDVQSLVSQLVTATRAPQDSLIATQTQSVTTQISAVGTLKGALSTFQTSLSALDTPSAFNALDATSSDATVFSATAGSDAVAGTYSVSVSQLAQAQQIVSTAFAGGSSAAIGTGSLKLSLGNASFNLTVDGSNDTVSGLAAAINAASGNPGITATVISGSDGAHLVLSSTETGAANTISVAETDGGGGLSGLSYDSAHTTHYTQDSAAQDAQFSISGIAHTSSSNTVSDALNGVALTLLGTTTGTASLTVSNDDQTIMTNVSAFVTAYNTLVGSISSLNGFDATTNTAGPMMGDALLSGIQNQIRSTLYSLVETGSSTYNSLAAAGITTNSDGTLSLDSATLQTALTSAPAAVSALFSGSSGVASGLNAQISADLAAGGSIGSRSQTLVNRENALTQQTDQLNTQMTALTASLTQQYSTLNALLSSLQSTSAYLSQQFAALPLVQGQPQA
jgi:flagellar hook-associated protein 2